MQFTDDRAGLTVEINSKGRELPNDQRARMQDRLAELGQAVAEFRPSRLWLNLIYHPRSHSYHAEAKLKLPGRTFFSGHRNEYLDTAFQRCMDLLLEDVKAYRNDPDRDAVEKARQRDALEASAVLPQRADTGPVADAARQGDYRRFRSLLSGYEDWLRLRIGRWVQRYPEADERIGRDILLGDLLEEAYLMAFENFDRRGLDVPLHDWLERWIDPAVKRALQHPGEVREEASLARTVREAPL